jgi:hypothetical protein
VGEEAPVTPRWFAVAAHGFAKTNPALLSLKYAKATPADPLTRGEAMSETPAIEKDRGLSSRGLWVKIDRL